MGSDIFAQLYETLLVEADVDREALVLDIGAKDGAIAAQLTARLDCRVVAIDIEFTDGARATDCDYLRGDGKRIPLADGAADAVISNMVFEHVPDEERLIRDIARVVAPDGTFICICPNRAWPGDGHGYPPGMPWLPQALGRHVASPYDKRYDRSDDWYQEAYFPVWSVSVRRQLQRHFDTVAYRSGALLGTDLDESSVKQRLLAAAADPLEKTLASRTGSRLVETAFPTALYVARDPK